jgi:hypothetical protein
MKIKKRTKIELEHYGKNFKITLKLKGGNNEELIKFFESEEMNYHHPLLYKRDLTMLVRSKQITFDEAKERLNEFMKWIRVKQVLTGPMGEYEKYVRTREFNERTWSWRRLRISEIEAERTILGAEVRKYPQQLTKNIKSWFNKLIQRNERKKCEAYIKNQLDKGKITVKQILEQNENFLTLRKERILPDASFDWEGAEIQEKFARSHAFWINKEALIEIIKEFGRLGFSDKEKNM